VNVSSRTSGFIVLEHDVSFFHREIESRADVPFQLFEQSVELATGYILPDALARSSPKLDIMPVSQCLGLPLATRTSRRTTTRRTRPRSPVRAAALVSCRVAS
jgi:hypothetical protein